VPDDSRIQELERRVEHDPASIAFAQLAEEYRRAGRLDDAIRVGRAGLLRHQAFPSVRVTLGRALLAQGRLDEARIELEAAATEAPDHIAATRALEEWRRVSRPEPSASHDTPVLQELAGWLDAVRADRARRAATSTGPHESVAK
jgi:predicted Zn-dependent protease